MSCRIDGATSRRNTKSSGSGWEATGVITPPSTNCLNPRHEREFVMRGPCPGHPFLNSTDRKRRGRLGHGELHTVEVQAGNSQLGGTSLSMTAEMRCELFRASFPSIYPDRRQIGG